MANNVTDITVVLDRSGSMHKCKADAEAGLNAFIQQQAAQTGEALFSLVQFDNVYEFVHRGVNLKKMIPVCSIAPRGSTALLDAVGRAIIETSYRLHKISAQDRPGLIVFVIITDGKENSSHEFTKVHIKEMIEHHQSVRKWQFTYIGANQDAFAEADGLGINPSSSLDFDTDIAFRAIGAASSNVSRMRHMFASDAPVISSFTDQERKELAGRQGLRRRIRLRGINGDIEGKVWESDTQLRAGRFADLEIVLDDSSVSRHHAEVRWTTHGWRVRDLGSTNGTFLNGTKLGRDERPVRAHDILRCGNVTFVVG